MQDCIINRITTPFQKRTPKGTRDPKFGELPKYMPGFELTR